MWTIWPRSLFAQTPVQRCRRGDIFSHLGDQAISVQFIVQTGSDHMIFCVAREDLEKTNNLVTALGAWGRRVSGRSADGCSEHFRSRL